MKQVRDFCSGDFVLMNRHFEILSVLVISCEEEKEVYGSHRTLITGLFTIQHAWKDPMLKLDRIFIPSDLAYETI